jgi:3-oxoacyl-[acyl-carrier protein] reductase
MRKLEQKVALLTGTGRGIGQAVAMQLSAEGAHMVGNDLDVDSVADTQGRMHWYCGKAVGLVDDVAAVDFADSATAAALRARGDIDTIVNNAGYARDSMIQRTSDAQWQAVPDIHVGGPFRLLRAAAGHLRDAARRGGANGSVKPHKVVNISSIVGLSGNAGQAKYSRKDRCGGLTQTRAKEWERYAINVNCVAYGLIETRMTAVLGSERASSVLGGRRCDGHAE